MAHRAATDEICVTGGMGNAPSSKRRGLVRVSACCLLAPKDLEMTDMEIAELLNMVRSSVAYRRTATLKLLKELMGGKTDDS